MSAEAGTQIQEKNVSLDLAESEENNPRLDRWINHTTVPLDLLALFTIWLTVVPLGGIHDDHHPFFWYAGRIIVSVIYAIDMAVRTVLARKKLHYFFHHPVGLLAVLLPVIRLIFSIRLLKAMFKKGNIAHFLFVSVVLLLNLMVIVWGFERHSSQANITSIGIAVWWGCVTVFTVGYGDYYPVTNAGRIAAVGIMVVGLTTAAVITAQIASSFMDQAQARRNSATESGAASMVAVAGGQSTDDRLDRIEDLLRTHFEGPDPASD